MKARLSNEQWREMVMDSILQAEETNGSEAIYASEVFTDCPIVEPKDFNGVLVELKRAGRIDGKRIMDNNGKMIDIKITVLITKG